MIFFKLATLIIYRVFIGSQEHILPIIIALLLGTLIIFIARTKLNRKQQIILFNVLGLLVSLTIIVFHVNSALYGSYDLTKDLPLFLCSFLALIIPVFTINRKFWMYEILVFWVIAGTTQGVITPDIVDGFPSFDYFRYWMVHLGLLIIIFYATFVFKMRPKFKSVFKSFFALQLYVIIMMFINYILDANYSYLNRKPESASVLDYLGEWPYYVISIQLIIIPFFLLIYLPFYLLKKENNINATRK